MHLLDFHEEVETEFNESYVWYGLEGNGLEENFRLAVDETYKRYN